MFTYIIFVLYNIIYLYYITNVFTIVIEHFSNILLMFIVNVFDNSFSVLFIVILKIFCVCWAFSFLCLVFLVLFVFTLRVCCEQTLRILHQVIKNEWVT